MAIVLFWLVAVTTHVSVDLFARYTTQDTGNDGARILAFGQLEINEESDGILNTTENAYEFIFTPGVNLKKDITVSFGGSEADTFLFVVLDTPGWQRVDDDADRGFKRENLLSWSVADGWTYLQSDGNQHVYYMLLDANTILEGQQVIAPLNSENSEHIQVNTATRNDYKALQGVPININATAYVVQANGFYNSDDMKINAAKAWASVKP